MNFNKYTFFFLGLATLSMLAIPLKFVAAHGDVTPQAIDTSELPDVGDDWLEENPWRDPASNEWAIAIKIGASGYNQNCARCHGLEVISGGLAPDLRYLEANIDGDEWYLERYRLGYTQNGTTKMPAFGELLGQKAAWAIRTYIETRPDDGALNDHTARLQEIRDQFSGYLSAGKTAGDVADELAPLITEMDGIAKSIATASEAPVADSAASRAVRHLSGETPDLTKATDALTVGLSAAE